MIWMQPKQVWYLATVLHKRLLPMRGPNNLTLKPFSRDPVVNTEPQLGLFTSLVALANSKCHAELHLDTWMSSKSNTTLVHLESNWLLRVWSSGCSRQWSGPTSSTSPRGETKGTLPAAVSATDVIISSPATSELEDGELYGFSKFMWQSWGYLLWSEFAVRCSYSVVCQTMEYGPESFAENANTWSPGLNILDSAQWSYTFFIFLSLRQVLTGQFPMIGTVYSENPEHKSRRLTGGFGWSKSSFKLNKSGGGWPWPLCAATAASDSEKPVGLEVFF